MSEPQGGDTQRAKSEPAEMHRAGPLLPWRRLPFPAPWPEIFAGSAPWPEIFAESAPWAEIFAGSAPWPEIFGSPVPRRETTTRPAPSPESSAEPAPLNLEVGFGDGRYTVRRAKSHPGEQFVGLEISTASVMRAVRRVRREGVTNVRLLKVGAQFAVRHLFKPASLASIVVNFPDPWPKERHSKNRLLQRSFFQLAASRLETGGEVLLATDHPEYLEFARQEAVDSGLYTLEQREPPPEVFETKYALKWRELGKPLFYQAFVVRGQPAAEFPVLERPAEMPHAFLKGSPAEGVEFSKRVLPYGDGHVILHEVARSLLRESPERWLVRVTVDEPDLKQQLLVAVQRREGSELIVRLEPFGDPIITRTARGAVHGVTEWLLEQPGVRVLERNY